MLPHSTLIMYIICIWLIFLCIHIIIGHSIFAFKSHECRTIAQLTYEKSQVFQMR